MAPLFIIAVSQLQTLYWFLKQPLSYPINIDSESNLIMYVGGKEIICTFISYYGDPLGRNNFTFMSNLSLHGRYMLVMVFKWFVFYQNAGEEMAVIGVDLWIRLAHLNRIAKLILYRWLYMNIRVLNCYIMLYQENPQPSAVAVN